MKRATLGFAATLLIIVIGSAQENNFEMTMQSSNPSFEIILNSGYLIPTSPMAFANYWKMQYGGGIGAGIPLSASITLLGSMEYYRFALDEDGMKNDFNTTTMQQIWIFDNVSMKSSTGTSSVMTASANLRFSPEGRSGILSPYFLAGLGLIQVSLSEIKIPTTSVLSAGSTKISMTAERKITGGTDRSFLMQFGMGLGYHVMPSLDVFIEARYAKGMNRELGTGVIPVVGGVKLLL